MILPLVTVIAMVAPLTSPEPAGIREPAPIAVAGTAGTFRIAAAPRPVCTGPKR